MGREGKKGSGRQRLPASGGAEGDQCSTLNVPPSVGIPQHCGTQLSTGQFTTKARRGGVPCQSCQFRRPPPPSWSRMESEGVSGIFQGISAYSSFFLRAQSSSGSRRSAGSQAAPNSFGVKLRRMGIRGEPVPALDHRQRRLCHQAFLAHCVQEYHGYLRLFPGISVYSCLFFFCSECHLFRSLFCLSSLRKKITLSSLNCWG
jgi:hypothetical protein